MNKIELSKEIICAFLEKNISLNNLNELYEIKSGNKKLLLEHLKALSNIFRETIEELEKSENNE